MAFSSAEVQRKRNFSSEQVKCMNCSIIFVPGQGVYGRRFCSEACRQEYMA